MVRNKQISEQMRMQSRAKLLGAGRRLFAERGYFNCTVSDLAQAAGMSPGNLYWYFDGKEDLLKAVLSEGFERIEALMLEAAAHPGDAGDKLSHLVDAYIQYIGEGSQFMAIFMSLIGHGGVQFLKELGFDTVAIGMRYHEQLTIILELAWVEGKLGETDANYLAVFFFSLFNGFTLTYPDGLELVPAHELKKAVMRLLGYLGD